ncbi:hypothetical protein [Fibrobacter sp.]|uniref:hypothetical protein n=1 Tax=Fibrobacter sp. TaxID=35828 RepID=UPI00261CB336|nr:hypothetical protein [Fibrobacter sp.]MDD5941955.1 hypothetical protein [Fibrobacter sp.]
METLIFIAIAVVITIIQKKLEKAKEQQNQLPRHQEQRRENGDVDDDTQETNSPPRSLQDLIRQFENAQRQATQGNIEPPTPPVHRKHPEQLTLRDIAEVVIEVDFINLEFLMDEFDVDENTAAEMLMDLQAHRIVGHDMGEGECDVLVHDLEELDNLLSHEKRAEQERKEALRQADERETDEEDSARQRELDRQRELNALEDRARSARDSAAAITEMGASAEASAEPAAAPKRPLVSTRNLADVRKGFIWAKVLDEPRFKRRWSTQYR